MNAYLVRLRHTMDDVPLAILPDKDTAIQFADAAEWQPTIEDQRAMDLPDMSTPLRIDVVEFVDGRPNAVLYVRNHPE